MQHKILPTHPNSSPLRIWTAPGAVMKSTKLVGSWRNRHLCQRCRSSCDVTGGDGFFLACPRGGELRTQKLTSHLVRTQSLNVLPLKPGVGQYVAIHATLTARDFFLAYLYSSSPFTCIFPKTSSDFFMCWLWLTHGSCVGPRNKIGHPAGGTFPCWVPAEYRCLSPCMELATSMFVSVHAISNFDVCFNACN